MVIDGDGGGVERNAMTPTTRRVFFWAGLGIFVAAGALLAFAPQKLGTVVGTTLGLAGAGLIGWSFVGRRGD